MEGGCPNSQGRGTMGSLRSVDGNGNENGKKAIECFHSRGQHLCKFIETKESVCLRKEFNSHNMAAVSLFWDTNMAPVTSCENTL